MTLLEGEGSAAQLHILQNSKTILLPEHLAWTATTEVVLCLHRQKAQGPMFGGPSQLEWQNFPRGPMNIKLQEFFRTSTH